MTKHKQRQQKQKIGKDILLSLYPEALSRTYSVPPIHFNRVSYVRETVAGQSVFVSHPVCLATSVHKQTFPSSTCDSGNQSDASASGTECSSSVKQTTTFSFNSEGQAGAPLSRLGCSSPGNLPPSSSPLESGGQSVAASRAPKSSSSANQSPSLFTQDSGNESDTATCGSECLPNTKQTSSSNVHDPGNESEVKVCRCECLPNAKETLFYPAHDSESGSSVTASRPDECFSAVSQTSTSSSPDFVDSVSTSCRHELPGETTTCTFTKESLASSLHASGHSDAPVCYLVDSSPSANLSPQSSSPYTAPSAPADHPVLPSEATATALTKIHAEASTSPFLQENATLKSAATCPAREPETQSTAPTQLRETKISPAVSANCSVSTSESAATAMVKVLIEPTDSPPLQDDGIPMSTEPCPAREPETQLSALKKSEETKVILVDSADRPALTSEVDASVLMKVHIDTIASLSLLKYGTQSSPALCPLDVSGTLLPALDQVGESGILGTAAHSDKTNTHDSSVLSDRTNKPSASNQSNKPSRSAGVTQSDEEVRSDDPGKPTALTHPIRTSNPAESVQKGEENKYTAFVHSSETHATLAGTSCGSEGETSKQCVKLGSISLKKKRVTRSGKNADPGGMKKDYPSSPGGRREKDYPSSPAGGREKDYPSSAAGGREKGNSESPQAEKSSPRSVPAEKGGPTSVPTNEISPKYILTEKDSRKSVLSKKGSLKSIPAKKGVFRPVPAEKGSPTSVPTGKGCTKSVPEEKGSPTSVPTQKGSSTSPAIKKGNPKPISAERNSPKPLPREKISSPSPPAQKGSPAPSPIEEKKGSPKSRPSAEKEMENLKNREVPNPASPTASTRNPRKDRAAKTEPYTYSLWPRQSPKDCQMRIRPAQYNDVQEDIAQHHVLVSLAELGAQLGEVMFILSEFSFDDYLKRRGKGAANGKPPPPVPGDLEQQYRRGDFDILVIHRHYGILVGEAKSVGWNQDYAKSSQLEADADVVKRVEKALSQLDKSETVMRHLLSDLPQPVSVKKALFLPYISTEQLRRVFDAFPALEMEAKRSLAVVDRDGAINRCCCRDQLTVDPAQYHRYHGNDEDTAMPVPVQLKEWWAFTMASSPDPVLSDPLYLDIVGRFVGPASSVSIHCVVPPRVEVRTAGEAVSELGRRLARLVLTPSQLDLVTRGPSRVCVTGPPGTGKTVVLILTGLRWLLGGNDVQVVSTRPASLASCQVMYYQLNMTFQSYPESSASERDSSESGRGGRVPAVFLHKFDFYHESEVDKAIAQLSAAADSRQGRLHILLEEAVFKDSKKVLGPRYHRLIDTLLARFPDLCLWIARVRHDNIPESLDKEILTQPLRSAPVVLREIQPGVNMHNVHNYEDTAGVAAPADGPKVMRLVHGGAGHSGQWPHQCQQCGVQVANVLMKELSVGSKARVTSKSPHSLRFRDVFVMTRDPNLSDDIIDDATGEVTSQASGLVRGLRKQGVPVCVLEVGPGGRLRPGDQDAERKSAAVSSWERDVADTAEAASDWVTVAHWRPVLGLERKVVVWLKGWAIGEDEGRSKNEVDAWDRVWLVSRCTTQLVVVDCL